MHERHGVSNHRQFGCLSNSSVRVTIKKSLRYWSCVREIHWWPVNSPHEGPVINMRKAFPYHGEVLASLEFTSSAILPIHVWNVDTRLCMVAVTSMCSVYTFFHYRKDIIWCVPLLDHLFETLWVGNCQCWGIESLIDVSYEWFWIVRFTLSPNLNP